MTDDLYAGLSLAQAADAERFLRFMDEWPQEQVDAAPDEWARAEQLTEFLRENGHDVSVDYIVRVIRSCELFDAIRDAS